MWYRLLFVTFLLSSCLNKNLDSSLATASFSGLDGTEYSHYTSVEIELYHGNTADELKHSFNFNKGQNSDIQVEHGTYYFKLRFKKDSELLLDSELCSDQDKIHELKAGVDNHVSISVCPTQKDETPSSGENKEMTLMTWNVHYENRNTPGIAKIINQVKPDIFGLNEFNASPQDLLAKLNPMGRTYNVQNYNSARKGFEGFGTKIFYDTARFEEIEADSITVFCPGTRGGNRAANYVLLKDKISNRNLITGGIHLSSCPGGCDSTHRCELSKFYEKLSYLRTKGDAPIVWMGDLNRGKSSTIFQEILSGGFMNNAIQAEDLSKSHRGTWHSNSGVIDYILGEQGRWERIAGGSTCQGITPQWLENADHYPAYATVKMLDGHGAANTGNQESSCPQLR